MPDQYAQTNMNAEIIEKLDLIESLIEDCLCMRDSDVSIRRLDSYLKEVEMVAEKLDKEFKGELNFVCWLEKNLAQISHDPLK